MKLINLYLVLITTLSIYSQSDGIQFQSLSLSSGIYNTEKIKREIGVSSSIEALMNIDQHLIASTMNVGFGFFKVNDVFKNPIHLFIEFDILYGRNFVITPDINFSLFTGIGFTEQTKLKYSNKSSSLTIPLRGKLIYSISQRLNLGVVSHLNFNHKNDIYMYQLLVEYYWF